MTIRLQEVMRSEVEGGLSGPANPLPDESIDCGCRQLPCPKLAKYATRRLFVSLLCWIGVLQGAAFAYFYVAGPTIARRFKLDLYVMDWVLVLPELSPFVIGLAVAYWGDRIHRTAWTGALVILQCVAYFVLIIPHLTHNVRVIEDSENSTHLSLYADDSPELCSTGSSRLVIEEDQPCYVTLAILIAVQIVAGMANTAYYALGISYLDDNTKKRHVAVFIGVILAVKLMGSLLGYFLAWGCLRIDAENLSVIESYQEQLGAWWLGFPILSIFLFVPGLIFTWFPRRLPSEIVEQAAASLLDRASTARTLNRFSKPKVGSTYFWPSFVRLITNNILVFNVIASVFSIAAILNFIMKENIILESRFHIPKPTGMLLGFGDPFWSRLTLSILKPVIIGLIIIISGFVVSKAKPHARYIAGYNFIIAAVAAVVIFSLVFTSCETPTIVGMERGSLNPQKFCNLQCRCSKEADFRPVCDMNKKVTFYSPCYAACTSVEVINNVRKYNGCKCVEDKTGQGNFEAMDGPCGSESCQINWLIFEFGTLITYALIASTFVGDMLINLRSVYRQDKALSIGFYLMWLAIFVHVFGKMLYDKIASVTCLRWGNEKSNCHLHEFTDYFCYLTGSLLLVSFILKLLVWFFCRNIRIYDQPENETEGTGRELQELISAPTNVVQSSEPTEPNNGEGAAVTSAHEESTATEAPENSQTRAEIEIQTGAETRLKYGPLGPGDRRTDSNLALNNKSKLSKSKIHNVDTDDELSTSSDESKRTASPKVQYKPLELDSDVESELSAIDAGSRRRIHSNDYSFNRSAEAEDYAQSLSNTGRQLYLNPHNYRSHDNLGRPSFSYQDGSWKTNSFEFNKNREANKSIGDFNEIGIPIDPLLEPVVYNVSVQQPKDVKTLINRWEKNVSRENLETDQTSIQSTESVKSSATKLMRGIPLVAMTSRPASRGQSSSGFSSLHDIQDKSIGGRQSDNDATGNTNSGGPRKKRAIITDL